MKADTGHSWGRRLAAVVVGALLAAANEPAGAAQRGAPAAGQSQTKAQDAGKAARSDVSIFVSGVDGAPGDGASSLSSALKKHLVQEGAQLRESQGKGTYTVKATVTVGEASGNLQPITIRWLVTTPQGDALANTVIQRNKVPSGSLDGSWGETSEAAGEAAAKGLVQMLSKAKK